MDRLKTIYQKKAVPLLKEKLEAKNYFQVPKLVKVNINVGIGKENENPKVIESVEKELNIITGQKPKVTRAKKAISGFKLRMNQKVGLAVTLRNDRMYDFVEKLINLVFPRIRDFRGLSTDKFDGHGNYSLGFREQTIFPELKFDEIQNIHGLQVNIITSTNDDNKAKIMLETIGFPFKKG